MSMSDEKDVDIEQYSKHDEAQSDEVRSIDPQAEAR